MEGRKKGEEEHVAGRDGDLKINKEEEMKRNKTERRRMERKEGKKTK